MNGVCAPGTLRLDDIREAGFFEEGRASVLGAAAVEELDVERDQSLKGKAFGRSSQLVKGGLDRLRRVLQSPSLDLPGHSKGPHSHLSRWRIARGRLDAPEVRDCPLDDEASKSPSAGRPAAESGSGAIRYTSPAPSPGAA